MACHLKLVKIHGVPAKLPYVTVTVNSLLIFLEVK